MTEFYAEVGSNHNGIFERAQALVQVAAQIGCAGVKFQYFRTHRLYASESKNKTIERDEVPSSWLPMLANDAHNLGLRFGCSVFDPEGALDAADHCDYLKISSYSLLDLRLLDVVHRTKKPIVMGLGMATGDEIDRALMVADPYTDRRDMTLLYCVSAYPAQASECNLRRLGAMRPRPNQSNRKIGWSDHTRLAGVVMRAVAYGAQHIECHLDLDGRGHESGAHCWLPDSLGAVIRMVKTGDDAEGTGVDGFSPSEAPERDWRADPIDGLRPMRWLRGQ